MTAVARKIETTRTITQAFGVLIVAVKAGFRVRTDDGLELVARRAIGCLVTPRAGDRVLLAGAAGSDEWYVLSVLTRDDASAVDLSAEGDMTVSAPTGSLTFVASGPLELMSGEQIDLAAPVLNVDARQANLAVRGLDYIGDVVAAQAGRIKLAAQTLDTVVDRLSQQVKRSFRFVEEIDVLRAEQADYTVRQLFHLRAKDALVNARQLVKMDAGQIHLG